MLSVQNRQRYVDGLGLLNKEFDREEMLVMATDINRTIMSAGSELYGWYEEGSLKPFTSEDERLGALPPFPVGGDPNIGAKVIKSSLWPIPIHTAYNG